MMLLLNQRGPSDSWCKLGRSDGDSSR